MFVPKFKFTVGRCLDVFVEDDVAVAFGDDTSGRGIFHAAYRSVDGGPYAAVLESSVAFRAESTILKHQIAGIAERLFSRDVAVHQTQVARVPSQVFAVQFGVVHGDVFHFPERILCGNPGMVDFNVFHVLEDVFAITFQPVYADVAAEHERVSPVVQLQVLYVQPVASPENFVGIVDFHILDFYVRHFAEHFGSIDACVGHLQMVGIPQGGASSHVEETAVDDETVHVPKGVIAFETAVGGDDVAAFFDGRFPGTDGHVVQMQVARAEQGAFAAKFHVFYQLHCMIVFKVCDFRSRIWLSYVSIPIIYVQSYANIMD